MANAPAERSAPSAVQLSRGTRVRMLLRCFMVQGAWNYEQMVGNGMGYCVEPALRALPGGPDGPAYRAAVARQSSYFNTHPYLAALAVGALARVELEGLPAERITRFRAALCGPLGSLGDRLVWAAWLPACSLIALLLFGAGAPPLGVAAAFILLYNSGHVALRAWGLGAGFRTGVEVVRALGVPWLQRGPQGITRAAALIAGFALPLASYRAIGAEARLEPIPVTVMLATPLLAVVLVRVQGKVQGWLVVAVLLALLILFATVGR